MAQNFLLNSLKLKFSDLDNTKPLINYERLQLYVNVFFVTLLTALGLRIFLALLLIEGKFLTSLSVGTYAFVEPFNKFLQGGNEMLQFPAILAFIVYYFTFHLANKLIGIFTNRPYITE